MYTQNMQTSHEYTVNEINFTSKEILYFKTISYYLFFQTIWPVRTAITIAVHLRSHVRWHWLPDIMVYPDISSMWANRATWEQRGQGEHLSPDLTRRLAGCGSDASPSSCSPAHCRRKRVRLPSGLVCQECSLPLGRQRQNSPHVPSILCIFHSSLIKYNGAEMFNKT